MTCCSKREKDRKSEAELRHPILSDPSSFSSSSHSPFSFSASVSFPDSCENDDNSYDDYDNNEHLH